MADLYRVLLTEGRYTTEEGPFDKATAMAQFEDGAPCCTPASGSFFRVVTEDEYRRIWPGIAQRNESLVAQPTAQLSRPASTVARPNASFTPNPKYRDARCGQQSSHGPHVMEHGPDEPRNCPGTDQGTTVTGSSA